MATLLVNSGKAIVTNRINGGGTTPLYVAWGTGAGTTSATDTTLFTEVSPRVTGTATQQTTSVTNDTFQVVGTQTAGTAETITNAGLFDASTSGNLFVKGDFSGIALNSGDSISFTVKVQFS
ncbi:tail collar fiber protein [Caudoviricetes sp.]|nr:tail collar fiber protein [Caudoviricetes sp.]